MSGRLIFTIFRWGNWLGIILLYLYYLSIGRDFSSICSSRRLMMHTVSIYSPIDINSIIIRTCNQPFVLIVFVHLTNRRLCVTQTFLLHCNKSLRSSGHTTRSFAASSCSISSTSSARLVSTSLWPFVTVNIFLNRWRNSFILEASRSETASLSLNSPRPIFSTIIIVLRATRHSWALSTSSVTKWCHKTTRFFPVGSLSYCWRMICGLDTLCLATKRNNLNFMTFLLLLKVRPTSNLGSITLIWWNITKFISKYICIMHH